MAGYAQPAPAGYAPPRPHAGVSTSSMGSAVTDTEEEEAKDRAKEILQEFLRNKARASEVERQLSRAFEENEGLIRLLQDKKYEMARERERHARELEHLKRVAQEQQQRLEASKHEVRKVAQTCAQRTADTAVQLQGKEGEVSRLEEELLAAREQQQVMRAEMERMRVERDELERVRGEVPERAQQRIAELARRVLEISKEKAAADQMIMEGNDKVAAAMRTVEEFRQMQRETDSRLQETERAREADRARFEATVRGLQQELEMQTTLYKKYVERLGAAQQPVQPHSPQTHPGVQTGNMIGVDSAYIPGSTFQPAGLQTAPLPGRSPSAGSPSRSAAELQRMQQQQREQLELQLDERTAQVKELQEALAQARQQMEEHWRTNVREKQSQFESLRQSQQDSDYAMQQMRQDLEASQDKIRALIGEKRNFESLQELYDQVKAERDDLRKECFSVALEAETAKRGQAELSAKMRQQQVDQAAQEKLAEELFRERDAREQAERALHAKGEQFRGEMALRDRQLDLQQDAYRQGQKSGREEMEVRLRELERERAAVEEENARLRAELQRQQELVQRSRDEVLQNERAAAEWANAFQTAEKHKVAMGLQQDELKGDVSSAQQEKVAAELRCSVLQQHVERLERQLREQQDRNERLTQAHAERELAIAQREVEFRDMEVRMRDQTQRQREALQREHVAESAMERQKVARELEVVQREAELRDQAQRREQERLLEQSTEELGRRELEISALRRELGQVRGNHGQLQNSFNTALTQAAALGTQLAVEQQRAAAVSPSRVLGRGALSRQSAAPSPSPFAQQGLPSPAPAGRAFPGTAR
eukprot:TRINITY_DN3150_c0_g1_i2.p1 TRINITY_DN3150_c0_g1~~TRINITY_DN3150_c0_g1_i2.p1  ORF type:complete len:828 (+),score=346.15 TRINITY_DN3150_c0_g1_i2:103-2586(+)